MMRYYHTSYLALKLNVELLPGEPHLPDAFEPHAFRAAEIEETERLLPHDACALPRFDLLDLEFLYPRYMELLVDPVELLSDEKTSPSSSPQALEDADEEASGVLVHDSHSFCNVILEEVLRDPAAENEEPVGHPVDVLGDDTGPLSVHGDKVSYRPKHREK